MHVIDDTMTSPEDQEALAPILSPSTKGLVVAAVGIMLVIPGILLTAYGIKALEKHQYITIVLGPCLAGVGLALLIASVILYSMQARCGQSKPDEEPICDPPHGDLYYVYDDMETDPNLFSRYITHSGLPAEAVDDMNMQPSHGIPMPSGEILHNGTVSSHPMVLRIDPQSF